jgi:hypothetical protein
MINLLIYHDPNLRQKGAQLWEKLGISYKENPIPTSL